MFSFGQQQHPFGASSLFDATSLFDSSLFTGGTHHHHRRKGADVVHPLRVSLADLYNGKTVKLQLRKRAICTKCNGLVSKPKLIYYSFRLGGKSGAAQTCVACHGRGVTTAMHQFGPSMYQQMQATCAECDGKGKVFAAKNRCDRCGGKKTVEEKKLLYVQVTRGMKDNEKIIFQGEGDQEPGITPGDVIIVIQTREHATFVRRGDDLYMRKRITLREALCGMTAFTVTHLDGRHILMRGKFGDVMSPGSWRGIVGEGMPRQRAPGQKGTLFIKFEVEFPEPYFHNTHPNRYKTLESLLPARPRSAPPPTGKHVDDVLLMPFDEMRSQRTAGPGANSKKEAHHEDDHDDDGGGENVRCAQS